MFADVSDALCFGPTWNELFSSPRELEQAWWLTKRDSLLTFSGNTPCYVYHFPTFQQRAQEMLDISPISRVHFAIKANSHPQILQMFSQMNFVF